MATFSFDIVSEYDKAEMDNIFALSQREIGNRYDFKGTPATIEWTSDKTGFKVIGAGEWQLEAVIDIIRKKMAARNQSSKTLDLSKPVVESNLKASQEIPFIRGLDQDKAKQITKLLREKMPKIKAQIQGEAVRVMSSSKNDLQAAMNLVKSHEFDFPVAFENYR